VEVGVQLDLLGASANEWPIVPAPGDYDDGEFGGMKVGRENRSTSPKSGGRSVGIVRFRSASHGVYFYFLINICHEAG
jgi:hypothetical protein